MTHRKAEVPVALMPGLSLAAIYARLLAAYGPQGWWPLHGFAGSNPTTSGAGRGYHPGDYCFPRDAAERFEICVGAILTQNTAWPNVERVLAALSAARLLSPAAILAHPLDEMARLIRPSGYFNGKARKLRELAAFHGALGGRTPTRAQLLAVWGIGPETADSIRLYAYGETEMVVDAYTRRVLAGLRLADASIGYEALKVFCVRGLPAETAVYQEFHALIVEHAKRLRAAKGLSG